MKKMILNVEGMHCNACKMLLEKSIGKIDQVEMVEASVRKGTVTIGYNNKIPNHEKIENTVSDCGYKVVDQKINTPWLSKNIDDYKIMTLSLIGFVVLYILLSKTGISELFDIKSQGSPSLSLVVLIGITAGFSSCMAVVGGLVLAISSKRNINNDKQTFGQKIVPHFRFNAGRIVGFGLLGGLLGLFGSVISVSPFMMSVMTLIVGVIMILLGINLTNISPKLSSIPISLPTGKWFAKKEMGEISTKTSGLNKYLGTFGSGILTFFLPCGFTFAMQLYAISSGSFWMGMIIMALFAVGTLPGLLGIGSLASIFQGKKAKVAYKVIGVLVILLGLYNISNSYNVVSTRVGPGTSQDSSKSQQTHEVIEMTYTDSGLTPSTLQLDIGKTYEIVIDAQTTVYGCMSTIYIPGLDENIQSIRKGNQIKFLVTPTKPGTYEFDCAMGISHNVTIIVQ